MLLALMLLALDLMLLALDLMLLALMLACSLRWPIAVGLADVGGTEKDIRDEENRKRNKNSESGSEFARCCLRSINEVEGGCKLGQGMWPIYWGTPAYGHASPNTGLPFCMGMPTLILRYPAIWACMPI